MLTQETGYFVLVLFQYSAYILLDLHGATKPELVTLSQIFMIYSLKKDAM